MTQESLSHILLPLLPFGCVLVPIEGPSQPHSMLSPVFDELPATTSLIHSTPSLLCFLPHPTHLERAPWERLQQNQVFTP